MSASTQYINLYREHAATVDAHSSDIMNSRRPEALEVLETKRLPRRGDEGYARFSVEDAFAPDYGINIARLPFDAGDTEAFSCLIPKVSSLTATIVNDHLVISEHFRKSLPAGVTVCTIAEASTLMPEVVERNYGRIAALTPTVALNTLLAQEGLFIHVAKGIRVDKTLQFTNLLTGGTNMLAPRRVLIVLEQDAKAEVLFCDHTVSTDHRFMVSQVVEIALADNASLGYYDLEESTPKTTRLSTLHASQGAASKFNVSGNTLYAGNTRNEYTIDLSADATHTDISGMVIASGSQTTDNSTLVLHKGRHGTSRQLFKYVVDDEARCAFEGLISVEEGAEYTEAMQNNRNLLASHGARMHTEPQLLINCDEVKCGHGATTGQLNEQALFYMRQRGIPLEEARTMLMQAFMADVIDTVRLEGLRDRLRYLVEKRFTGRRVLCSQCRHSQAGQQEGGSF